MVKRIDLEPTASIENQSRKENIMQKLFGVIGLWNLNKGFGFIRQFVEGNLKSYFFHISSIRSGIPEKEAPCSFVIGANSRGECAIEVEIMTGVRS